MCGKVVLDKKTPILANKHEVMNMKKREFVKEIENLGAWFDTDYKVWKVQHKKVKTLKNFLAENSINWTESKKCEGLLRIECSDNLIVYVMLEKEYRKVGEYRIIMEKGDKVYLNSIKDNASLKKFVSKARKVVSSIKVYDSNGVAVSKSLWM